jgi:hypothetical protein
MATKTIAGIARAALASRAAAAECCSTAARRHGRALREPALGGGKLRDAGQALGQASGEGIHCAGARSRKKTWSAPSPSKMSAKTPGADSRRGSPGRSARAIVVNSGVKKFKQRREKRSFLQCAPTLARYRRSDQRGFARKLSGRPSPPPPAAKPQPLRL